METSERPLAIVLAGGSGTRIRHLHPDVPKPMIPVAGAPFLYWVLLQLRRQGMSRAVISTGHLSSVIEQWVASQPVPGLALATAREDRPLGTAGGFLHALEVVREPWSEVIVANSDSLVLADLAPALAAIQGGDDAAVVGIEVADASRYGTLEVAMDDRLVAFREKRPGPALVNAGIYVFARRTIEALPRTVPLGFEVDVFPALLARGRTIRVARTAAPFIDIGIPESLARADAFVRQNFGG